MKAAKIVLVLLVTMGLVVFVRGGRDFSLAKALPFCGGHKPGFYDFGALALLALAAWGLTRLHRPSRAEDPTPSDTEPEADSSDSRDDDPTEGSDDDDSDQSQDNEAH